MDNRQQQRLLEQKRAQRQKYLRRQMYIRIGGILLAIVLALIALIQGCSTRKAVRELSEQLREKKLAQAQEELLALQATPSPSPSPVPENEGARITLSFVGECNLGVDNNHDEGYLLENLYNDNGATYFFENVKSILEGDDLTVASLACSLTEEGDRQNWNDVYRADPEYSEVLTYGGVDAVTVANPYYLDYGEEGYVDTLANLDKADIGRFGFDYTLMKQIKGVKVGFTGVWKYSYLDYEGTALDNIAYLREEGAQIVVAVIQWTSNSPDTPDNSQILLAHKFIDAGADLVIGIMDETIQGIEVYHDRYIVYSLGAFLSAVEEPENMDSMIFQQTFTLVNGELSGVADYEIIPCCISSNPAQNDCRPTPLEGDEKQRLLDHIYDMSIELDGGIEPKE